MNQTADVANQIGQNAPVVAEQGSIMGMIVYCLVIFGILYLFMIRPNRKRMAEYQKMLDSIQVGNRVLATGIYGKVKKVNEKTIEMEIAKGVVIEVNKNAVAGIEQ
ncbi:MAG: preprotein translocase subunit YajC [Alphaproteobacteria bacterium]|nr:preprotein translocase subunit YajC [Alphaproteobacteria bacterium]